MSYRSFYSALSRLRGQLKSNATGAVGDCLVPPLLSGTLEYIWTG